MEGALKTLVLAALILLVTAQTNYKSLPDLYRKHIDKALKTANSNFGAGHHVAFHSVKGKPKVCFSNFLWSYFTCANKILSTIWSVIVIVISYWNKAEQPRPPRAKGGSILIKTYSMNQDLAVFSPGIRIFSKMYCCRLIQTQIFVEIGDLMCLVVCLSYSPFVYWGVTNDCIHFNTNTYTPTYLCSYAVSQPCGGSTMLRKINHLLPVFNCCK